MAGLHGNDGICTLGVRSCEVGREEENDDVGEKASSVASVSCDRSEPHDEKEPPLDRVDDAELRVGMVRGGRLSNLRVIARSAKAVLRACSVNEVKGYGYESTFRGVVGLEDLKSAMLYVVTLWSSVFLMLERLAEIYLVEAQPRMA